MKTKYLGIIVGLVLAVMLFVGSGAGAAADGLDKTVIPSDGRDKAMIDLENALYADPSGVVELDYSSMVKAVQKLEEIVPGAAVIKFYFNYQTQECAKLVEKIKQVLRLASPP